MAGPEGKALEAFYNTELAALKIYKASDSPISPVRFYDTDVEALADMKSRADAAMGAIK